jgi:hypothetical protein
MGDQSHAPSSDGPSEAIDAVAQAWHAVAESLGTTATAALMRRAAKRASGLVPALHGFRVEGAGYSYRYDVPASWRTPDAAASGDVRALLGELCALLSDLTGEVVTSRLASTPAVRPFLPAEFVRRSA